MSTQRGFAETLAAVAWSFAGLRRKRHFATPVRLSEQTRQVATDDAQNRTVLAVTFPGCGI